MGKLHRIRKAYAKLTPERRREIHKWSCGVVCYPNGRVGFGWPIESRKNYVAKLGRGQTRAVGQSD